VKIRFFGKEVILVVCFIFLFSALAFAQGTDMQFKGKVMKLDLAKKMVVVNEHTFFWNQTTLFYDENGSPLTITEDRLKKGTLVSIETTWIKNKPYIIKKLSLLPPK